MDQTMIRQAFFCFLLVCVTSFPLNKEQDIDIYSFHINSTVTSRYATTVITSRVANRLNESKEINFEVKIPKNAFISKFRMTIEGKTFDAVIKEKEEAQQQYTEAASRGESAGIVSSVGRTLEEFKTSVTVAALSKVTFELTYEELLKRRLGKYDLLINARPMQPVTDFKIDVYLHESPGISLLEVKGKLSADKLASAVSTVRDGKEAWVSFYPTREQQTMCDGCGENGLNGALLITYDVDRTKPQGELQASNGYFVHYFAPSNVERIPKNVVFIIDKSGSMRGKKIEQTRLALLKILGDLAADDFFGLITFDSIVKVWRPELLQATDRNLEAAKAFVREIQQRGATDINSAVLKGVEMINSHPREGAASILILLTDGAPNTGVSDPKKIQANVKEAINEKFPLYCLGFGFDVNFNFLKKMALENNGDACRIYEDSDADLQLQGFYEEVATPLLTNVQLNYIGASNLTRTVFGQYYNGSEIVVAGQITDNSLETFQVEVLAISKSKNVSYQDSVTAQDFAGILPQHKNFIQRLWAYLTVKQLLEKELTLNGQEKETVKKEALALSLKYKFVTPLTSLVVTKPQGEDMQVAHKPKEAKEVDTLAHRFHTRQVLSARSPMLSSGGRTPVKLHPDRSVRFFKSSGKTHVLNMIMSSVSSRLRATPLPVLVCHLTPPPPASVRFLLSSPNQTNPLCYDVPTHKKLQLFLEPSSDFAMNGKLSLKGFRQIILHFKTHQLRLSTTEIHYDDELNHVRFATFVWGQESTNYENDSVSLNLRNNEMDVTMGAIRIVIFLHKSDGSLFLWPAVRQQLKNHAVKGMLGKIPEYKELPGSVVRIKDQEVTATWSKATDYRLPSAPTVACWLVPLQFALGEDLSDFTVPQL